MQIPNAGDENQSCHILTVIFDWIDQLRIPKYNIYISTLFYTNVSISTNIWGVHWVHLLCKNLLGLLSSDFPSLVSS